MNMGDSALEDEDFPGRLLHQAALWDNAELLEDLLRGDQLAHIDSQDSWGRTPLHAAATSDKSRCLCVLLKAGGNPNISCGPRGLNMTPLHISAEHGHLSNVHELLQHRADIALKNKNGLTALEIAELGGHTECKNALKEALAARESTRQAAHMALREAVSSGDALGVRSLLADLMSDAKMITNMAPSGSNTLLFLACEQGNVDVVRELLRHEVDGRTHPVTQYSPLYIACFRGHVEIVRILLERFPERVQHCTVEKWLPFHAACINGHVEVVEELFKYKYPSSLMKTFRDPTGEWEYEMPFDVNMKDGTGQSALYLACVLGNLKMVEFLLKFRVKVTNAKPEESNTDGSQNSQPQTPQLPSPTKRRISLNIHSIMSRLNSSNSCNELSAAAELPERTVCPIQFNLKCHSNGETALHAAVRGRHKEIVSALLAAGADADVLAQEPHPEQLHRSVNNEEEHNAGGGAPSGTKSVCGTTPLVEACFNRDVAIVDYLLKSGARDDDCRALKVAAASKDDILLAKLLAIKALPDPEYKINKKAMGEKMPTQLGGQTSLTYSTLFPNTPAMINWHGCGLAHIKMQWLIDAVLHVNPKLKLNPKNHDVALFAITRLDLSNNVIEWLPPAALQLRSLKYFNLAQNKIEKLPEGVKDGPRSPTKYRRRSNASNIGNEAVYNMPVLEELYLQDNRLEQIPEEIFRLPALVTLDLSNNKLQSLPYALWKAPKLKEMNVAFNLLKDLPTNPPEVKDSLDNLSTSSVEVTDGTTTFELVDNFNLLSPTYDGRSDLHAAYNESKSVISMEIVRHNIWSDRVEVTEQILHAEVDGQEDVSQLSALNLAHNAFTKIPPALPCLAVNLTRLNLAYNRLRSMGYMTSYPASLKQLDLSHNQVCCWPSLPQLEFFEHADHAAVVCYALSSSGENHAKSKLPNVSAHGRSLRSTLLDSVCVHRRHLRLDNMRTLILADNNLSRIQLATDEDDDTDAAEQLNAVATPPKSRLMMPNLSMLDLSNNQVREIPQNIHELSNLSVLNVSGNSDICELPQQMGLLSRLWNLNTRGCNLQEPLKSMIESKKFKTMDVIGYLKSVLEDAKPYARMKLMIVGIQGIGKTSLLEQLRQEGTGTFRKKPVEHWAKRMGNKNVNVKTSRGINMSTVGVDIGDWVYEKKGRAQSQHGPVVFRTWDFGGQREYYATHQYFLSKRSLYLVVWKISDGQRGISEILQWLVNIQARAPNSPVLIVGTHYDLVTEQQRPGLSSEDLQQYIRDKFINIVDAEKCGLPRVLDTIEVSCKTRHNIKLLCNLIYDTVFSLRPPGSKEPLLAQRIPAMYLRLEDIICQLAMEKRQRGEDPVLNAEQYRATIWCEMVTRYGKTFRDAAEVHQATLFLHDNGVLLHYDDATLKDFYFLDPQWLCDMLAHVVTIREINPFARSGVMKLDDLKLVFKSSQLGPVDTRGYIVSLLNKFEVALTWDSRTLLIPSLLPSEEDLKTSMMPGGVPPIRVKIPVRSRGWAVRSKRPTGLSPRVHTEDPAVHKIDPSAVLSIKSPNPPPSPSPSVGSESGVEPGIEAMPHSPSHCELSRRLDPERCIRRLLLMSYFPSGFWSRLMTRVLADDAIVDIIRSFFTVSSSTPKDARVAKLLDVQAEWVLWQTGMELQYADIPMFRMKEVLPTLRNSPVDYRQLKLKLRQEGVWTNVDLANSSILEVYFPVETIVFKYFNSDNQSGSEFIESEETSYLSIALEPSPEHTTKLLALIVDHIDILLEDWYPTLGTRFVHTSEGKFLVTRLVPCPRCLASLGSEAGSIHPRLDGIQLNEVKTSVSEAFHSTFGESQFYTRRVRISQESYTSDGDSGVGRDSVGSSRNPSMEGHPNYGSSEFCSVNSNQDNDSQIHYSWMVEECILAAYEKTSVTCPTHGEIPLAQVAPDTIFVDLGEKYLIRSENVKRGQLLGRGAFGFVFKGSCRTCTGNSYIDVAMKMLQPVQPGANARQSAVIAYKAAQGKWERDPLQYATKAYCTARQELNILLALRHPNIVPLVGVCTKPLALVLDLAPQGALDAVLRNYRRSGARLGPHALQAITLQAAKALEYLHQQHIIYRDLKSENVLVWSLPRPFNDHPDNHIHIKLADYGISRQTLPSGTKGFGGTEGFMAPEIMRYNGEEEYTEKVDCFSFGMFIYELLTLHQPFEGHESVKECILEGGRPPLTFRETQYPTYILDLMALCWAQQPVERPSASQVVSIASTPEFTHLCDVMSLDHNLFIAASASVRVLNESEGSIGGIWLASNSPRADLLLASPWCWLQYHTLQTAEALTAASCVADSIWLGDVQGRIHSYSSLDCSLQFSYLINHEQHTAFSAIGCIFPLPSLSLVVVGFRDGALYLLRSDVERSPVDPSHADDGFIKFGSEHENVFFTMSAVSKDTEESCELWVGGDHGKIDIYEISHTKAELIETIKHGPTLDRNPADDTVHRLVSSQCDLKLDSDPFMFSCLKSSVVYQWDVVERVCINKLDCCKLVPCSESLKSIRIEKLRSVPCKVTCMCVFKQEIYIGTTWGCVVVAECATLRPITVFRPFENDVVAIVPVMGQNSRPAPLVESTAPTETPERTSKGRYPVVATLGYGYRSLIARYTDSVISSVNRLRPKKSGDARSNICALLWRAEHWTVA